MTKVLEFKNSDINLIAQHILDFNLKNKASRGAAKLQKAAVEKAKEYQKDLDEIRMPYFEKDKNGDPVSIGNEYVYKDPSKKKELTNKINELNDEVVGIEFVEYSEKIKALYDALDEFNEDMNGQKAYVYDLVLDQLEKNFDKQEKEGK